VKRSVCSDQSGRREKIGIDQLVQAALQARGFNHPDRSAPLPEQTESARAEVERLIAPELPEV
jgi:hypothetical protein